MMNLKNGKFKRFISCATWGAIMLTGLGSISSVKALDEPTYISYLDSLNTTHYSRHNAQTVFFQYLNRIIEAQKGISESEQTPGAHFFPRASAAGNGSLEGGVHKDLIRGNLKPGMELGVFEFPDNPNKLLINVKRLTVVTGFCKSLINLRFHDAGYCITPPTPDDLALISYTHDDYESMRHWTVRTKNAGPATAQLPRPIAPPQPPPQPPPTMAIPALFASTPQSVNLALSDDVDAWPSPTFNSQYPSFGWPSPWLPKIR